MIEGWTKEHSSEEINIPSISAGNSSWRAECERLHREGVGFRVVDIVSVEQIEFVSKFAAIKNLNMTVEGRSFVVTPRRQ